MGWNDHLSFCYCRLSVTLDFCPSLHSWTASFFSVFSDTFCVQNLSGISWNTFLQYFDNFKSCRSDKAFQKLSVDVGSFMVWIHESANDAAPELGCLWLLKKEKRKNLIIISLFKNHSGFWMHEV